MHCCQKPGTLLSHLGSLVLASVRSTDVVARYGGEEFVLLLPETDGSHAGAIAGSGDDARAKEEWFMKKFGVDSLFTPENPVCSKKGAVVTNISHIPQALTAVMKLNGIERDFAPEGNLELKPWFGDDQGLKLPSELNIPVVKAMSPYDEQIAELLKNVGAIYPRQSMKDCSGSSVMDPKTQVTKVNNISILDCSKQPLESNLCLAVVRELNDANDNAVFNLAVAAQVIEVRLDRIGALLRDVRHHPAFVVGLRLALHDADGPLGAVADAQMRDAVRRQRDRLPAVDHDRQDG